MFSVKKKENGFDLMVEDIKVFVRKGLNIKEFDDLDYNKSKKILGPWIGDFTSFSSAIISSNIEDKEVKDFLVEFFNEGCYDINKESYISALVINK